MSDSFTIISDLRGQLIEAHKRIEQLEAQILLLQSRMVTNVLTDEDRKWAIDTARAMGMDEE